MALLWCFTSVLLLIAAIILANLQSPAGRKHLLVGDLSPDLRAWEEKGSYKEIFGQNVFFIHMKASRSEVSWKNKTCIVLHGFPSSSFEYSYGAASGLVRLGYDVIMHDHVGFGFSDKPESGFGYSIHDHAEVAIALYSSLASDILESCHFIAHDMGDSILTELMTRYSRDHTVLPKALNIIDVIFTNGGMYMAEANLRLSQVLLTSRFSQQFNNLIANIDKKGIIAKQQIRSIFSSSIRNSAHSSIAHATMMRQIKHIQDLLDYKRGNILLWRLSRYLQDRYACEERWLSGIKMLKNEIRFSFAWGTDDSVAPLSIPINFIEKANLQSSELILVEGKGHFWMMEEEDGDFWAQQIHTIINNNNNNNKLLTSKRNGH